jgi:hypothetical protein
VIHSKASLLAEPSPLAAAAKPSPRAEAEEQSLDVPEPVLLPTDDEDNFQVQFRFSL